MLMFLIGFMIGGAFGLILMSLLNAAKYDERMNNNEKKL